MIENYFKIACRNLSRNKIFSLINIAGLSIGISSALVIYLIVSYDFSFDKFQKDGDSDCKSGKSIANGVSNKFIIHNSEFRIKK